VFVSLCYGESVLRLDGETAAGEVEKRVYEKCKRRMIWVEKCLVKACNKDIGCVENVK